MCDVEPDSDDLAFINGCEHRFCFGCIDQWSERENTCPLCKNRFTKIDRVNKKRKKGVKNSKKVKQRDQRSDIISGAAIEGLLGKFKYRMNVRSQGDLDEPLLIQYAFFSHHQQPISLREDPLVLPVFSLEWASLPALPDLLKLVLLVGLLLQVTSKIPIMTTMTRHSLDSSVQCTMAMLVFGFLPMHPYRPLQSLITEQ
jgi:hypothetical protein